MLLTNVETDAIGQVHVKCGGVGLAGIGVVQDITSIGGACVGTVWTCISSAQIPIYIRIAASMTLLHIEVIGEKICSELLV
jgi:hypothetical protein